MKPARILVFTAFLAVFSPTVSFAIFLGPYSGIVIDSQTGYPIEGASVLFYWEKRVPTPPSGGISEPIEIRLIYTDKKGFYDIPRILANLGLLGFLESTKVIIYQPGYQAYVATILHDRIDTKPDPSFKPKDNRVKLDRIPPNFDHKEHYRMIEDALSSIHGYGWEDRIWGRKLTWEEHLKLNVESGILEKEELLRRAEWENPHSGFSLGDPENLQKWMGLLKTGNEKERKLALIQLPASLKYPAIQEKSLFDPVLQAFKDKNPSIRVTAAASLKLFGRSHPGDLEEKKRISLQRELVKKGDPHFKKTFPESLSYHEARNLIVPHLLKALGDNEPKVRQEAAKAVAFYKNEDTIGELIRSLNDKDPWVRLQVVSALGELRALKAVDPLLNLLEDDSDWRNKFVQQECVKALRRIGSPTAIGLGGQVIRITPEIRSPDGKIVTPGTSRIDTPDPPTKIGGFDDETTAKVISVLIQKSDDPYLRDLIIGAFGQFQAVEARDILLNSVKDPDEKIRKLALGALTWLPEREEEKFEILRASLKDPSISVRVSASAMIAGLKDPRVVDSLSEALRDSDQTVQLNAIKGLGPFKDERILDDIIPFLGWDRQNLHQATVDTFKSVARNTIKERVYVYRKDGFRHVTRNRAEIPWGVKTSERLIHPKAVGTLLDFINRSDQKKKLAALDLVSQFEDKRIEELLIRLLEDPSPELRKRAISLSPLFCQNVVIPKVIVASRDKDREMRWSAVQALGQFEDKKASEPLMERLSDDRSEIRAAALDALRGNEDPKLLDLTIKLLGDESVSVRGSAIKNIKEKPDRRAIEALILRLNDGDQFVSSTSAEILGTIGDKTAVNPLIKALKGEFNRSRPHGGDATLRMNAAKALGSIKDRSAVAALIGCLSDENPYVRRRIVSALKEIGDPTGLEAIKGAPKDILPPEIGSPTPTSPKVLKPPPPAIRKDSVPVPGSGYSVTMFGSRGKKEEKPSPPKEEKPAAIPTPPPARIVGKYDLKPRPSIGVKPLLTKLKVNDPKIRREAADSLGDAGSQEATDHLIPLLKDKDEYVRQAAARALGKLKDKKAVEPLIAGLKDPDVNVRAFSVWGLGKIQDTQAIEPLCNSLLDKEQKVKDQSFEALRRFRKPVSRTMMVNTLIKNAKVQPSAELMLSRLIRLEGKEVILRATEDSEGDKAKALRNYMDLMEANIQNVSDIASKNLVDYPDRGMVISELSNYINTHKGTPAASISLLGRLKDRRVLPILLDTLNKRKDSYSRLNVINAIGELGDKGAVEPLLQILVNDKEFPGPRTAAARALAKYGDARAVEPLLRILKDERENKGVRRDAASALGTFRDKRAVEPLINILKSSNEDIWLRVAAASSLGDIGDERAIEPLETAMKDPSDPLKNVVGIALRKMKASR